MVARTIELPNVKKCLVPDPGFTLCECDLAQADAQVVAWDAHDESLMQIFREKLPLHATNCEMLFGSCSGDKDPNYKKAKMGVHATNYLVRPKSLAHKLGLTVKEAEAFQNRWFAIHPAIKEWHKRIMSDLASTRSVVNAFGYRRIFFDRVERIATKAVAWIPQSTVGFVINEAIHNLRADPHCQELGLEYLLQIHDSHLTQFPTRYTKEILPHIKRCSEIIIPYDDPLIISIGCSLSTKSWGDCTKTPWPEE